MSKNIRRLSEQHKRAISLAHTGMKKPWSNGKQNIGKKRTEEWKKRMSEIMKTENKRRLDKGVHNLWKGGKTKESLRIRASADYKLWREAVFARDNWTCIWCGQIGGQLNADHVKPFALFPELRLAIDNGRTLCERCHKTTDTFCGRKTINKAVIKSE